MNSIPNSSSISCFAFSAIFFFGPNICGEDTPVIISIVLLLGGKSWSFWLGGFLFLVFAAYGYWIDYIKQIQWRNPINLSIMFPYVFLYLSTVMFYWWPLGQLSRTLWFAYAILFVIATVLNITSH